MSTIIYEKKTKLSGFFFTVNRKTFQKIELGLVKIIINDKNKINK